VSLRASLFETAGRIVVRLPRFRGRTRACLLLFRFLGLQGQHTFVETTLSAPVAYRVRLDLHSWLQRIAFLTGEYEAETVRFLLELHRSTGRRDCLLDIGANIGLISIPAALQLEAGQRGPRVVSIEAVSDNAAALRHNISLNSAHDLVTVIEAALGDHEGIVDIQVEGDLSAGEGTGTANILPIGSTLDPNGKYECVRNPVAIRTLDSLWQEGRLTSSCSVVKIDTDGYDLKILEGALGFLDACRPVIFGEFSAHCLRWHGQSIGDVEAFARARNYEIWQRLPGHDRPRFTCQLNASTYSQDVLLVPAERIGSLAWCQD
jgi:FkbM family methyltransferase